jgi:hypothetical protein
VVVGVDGVEGGDRVVEVDVVEMLVKVDAVGGVPCGCSEGKQKIRYSARTRIKYAQSACSEIHLADEEGMVGEDSDADKVGYELGDDVVGG